MNVQQLPSSSGSSRFPSPIFQEFIPAAMRNQQRPSRGMRPSYPPALFPQGPPPMRPPRFYYSRPLAPQYIVPRRGGGSHFRSGVRPYGGQQQQQQQYAPEFHPQFVRSENNEPPKDCICERPEMMIVCQRCGSELFGRIQRQCPAHLKRIQLMDHSECANKFCRSLQLVEVPVSASDKP